MEGVLHVPRLPRCRPLDATDDVPRTREPRTLRAGRHQPTDVVLMEMCEDDDVNVTRADPEPGEVRVERASHLQPTGRGRPRRSDAAVDQYACAGGADQHDVRAEPPATVGADGRRKPG